MKTKLLKYASEIFKESDIVVGDMDKKIAILFANYDSMGYLGQPVLNDCVIIFQKKICHTDLFATNVAHFFGNCTFVKFFFR